MWNGSALVSDRRSCIDKKNSDVLVVRAKPFTDPMQWIATKDPSNLNTNSSNTIRNHGLGQWNGSALVLDGWNGIDKKNPKYLGFRAKQITDPMQWIHWIPTINDSSKVNTNSSNTIRVHRSGQWNGSALVPDRRNGIDKKNPKILGFSSKTMHRSHAMNAMNCHQRFM